MVGAAVAVFFRGSSEFRHRHKDDIRNPVAHVLRECGERIAELLEELLQLRDFVGVVIPSSDFSEGGLDSNIRFDEPCNLLQSTPEFTKVPVRTIGPDGAIRRTNERAVRWSALLRRVEPLADGLNQLHRL